MASWSAFRGVRLRELDKKASVGSVLPEIDFSIDPNSLQALSKKFQAFPGAVQEAIVEATEKTRRYTRSEIIRALKVVASLKPAYISRGVAGGKAKETSGGAQAEVRIATRRVPLGRYAVSPERPPQLKGVPVANRRRVSYTLRLGGTRYGDTSPSAPGGSSKLFVQGMGSGHIGVFYRDQTGLHQEYAPSLQYHAYADGFIEKISSLTSARFESVFCEAASSITGVI